MAGERVERSDAEVDWRRLRPNRALEPGSQEYAWRPEAWNGATRLAALILGDMGPLIVTGPSGSGKTTELGAMIVELRDKAVAILVTLDRLVEPRDVTVNSALVAMTRSMAKTLAALEFEPSALLRSALSHLGHESVGQRPEALEALRRLVHEARVKTRRRLAIVVDGMNRFSAALSQELAELLRPLAREASLVLTAAPSATLGPEARSLNQSYRVLAIGAVPVLLELPGSAPTDAWKFLNALALQRLGLQGWPENVDRYAYKAALCSAGIPRQFLQFLQDAVAFSMIASHRRIMRGDMRLTYRQNHEAAIRMLRDGDLPAIERCRGTNGIELPLEMRRRLFDLGLVLEYDAEGKTIVLPHPILTEYTVSPFVDQSFL